MSILGIDLGGSFIKYGVFQGEGLIFEGKVETPKTGVEDLAIAIDEIIAKTKSYDIKKVGLAAPGGVDSATGIITEGGALTYLHNVNMKELFKQRYDLEVSVENDGKAAALAELGFGELKEKQSGCVIVLGTGVGGGIILNRQLYKGIAMKAGEFSYMIYDFPNKKAVGADCSAVMFIHKLAKVLDVEPEGRKVFEALVTSQNEAAMGVFQEYCFNVAQLIYNLQAVLDVERYVIGGGISQQPMIVEGIKKTYEGIIAGLPSMIRLGHADVVGSTFGQNAVLWGSVYPHLVK